MQTLFDILAQILRCIFSETTYIKYLEPQKFKYHFFISLNPKFYVKFKSFHYSDTTIVFCVFFYQVYFEILIKTRTLSPDSAIHANAPSKNSK